MSAGISLPGEFGGAAAVGASSLPGVVPAAAPSFACAACCSSALAGVDIGPLPDGVSSEDPQPRAKRTINEEGISFKFITAQDTESPRLAKCERIEQNMLTRLKRDTGLCNPAVRSQNIVNLCVSGKILITYH